MSATHPFRKAVEEGDEAAIQALLADDVVFTSPVAFKPYVGKPITAAILRGVLRVFQDFRYVREIHDPSGNRAVRHAVLLGALVLREGDAPNLLDRAKAYGTVGGGARQHHADGAVALVSRD